LAFRDVGLNIPLLLFKIWANLLTKRALRSGGSVVAGCIGGAESVSGEQNTPKTVGSLKVERRVSDEPTLASTRDSAIYVDVLDFERTKSFHRQV
jgi:hypothetical protein